MRLGAKELSKLFDLIDSPLVKNKLAFLALKKRTHSNHGLIFTIEFHLKTSRNYESLDDASVAPSHPTLRESFHTNPLPLLLSGEYAATVETVLTGEYRSPQGTPGYHIITARPRYCYASVATGSTNQHSPPSLPSRRS